MGARHADQEERMGTCAWSSTWSTLMLPGTYGTYTYGAIPIGMVLQLVSGV